MQQTCAFQKGQRKLQPPQPLTAKIALLQQEAVEIAVASQGMMAHFQRTWKPLPHRETSRWEGRMSLCGVVARTVLSCGPCRCHKRMVSLDCDPLLAVFLDDSVPVRNSEIVVEAWA